MRLTTTQVLHIKLFPEEYDHIYDSVEDLSLRRRGISPMDTDYILRINQRRQLLNVEPFDPITPNNSYASSWKLCVRLVEVLSAVALQEILNSPDPWVQLS